jgi:hypothetical protein
MHKILDMQLLVGTDWQATTDDDEHYVSAKYIRCYEAIYAERNQAASGIRAASCLQSFPPSHCFFLSATCNKAVLSVGEIGEAKFQQTGAIIRGWACASHRDLCIRRSRRERAMMKIDRVQLCKEQVLS